MLTLFLYNFVYFSLPVTTNPNLMPHKTAIDQCKKDILNRNVMFISMQSVLSWGSFSISSYINAA